MKLFALLITVAALYSKGECYDYYDNFGMGMAPYQSDYGYQFEPEVRSMMIDEPDNRPAPKFTPIDIPKTTKRPALKIQALQPTSPPTLSRKTFKPFTRRPQGSKPVTGRALKAAPLKTPKPVKLIERPKKDKE
ncbi:unnamed protein product [Orchesella dallaii]|uniref:Uncharacterized protein n=1 Tax=Orchesella dallaii TaxID=48710 RepID=A0ABP1RAK0_9HEXA